MKCDIAIIGAGPAGMMAAIAAASKGRRVCLIDRNEILGRKIYATGNGRCNISNVDISIDRYHGGDLSFIKSILERFDGAATVKFFEDLGLILNEGDNGRLFPRTNQAASVVEVLHHRLISLGVETMLGRLVKSITPCLGWKISFDDGTDAFCKKLILATGGRAANHLGSTGDGQYWATKLGHALTPIHAALVPMEMQDDWPMKLQGLRIVCHAWATCEGEKIRDGHGDVLFTAYGLSGPAIMTLSGGIAPKLKEKRTVLIHIDPFPDFNREQLSDWLGRICSADENRTIAQALIGMLPARLIPFALEFSGVDGSLNAYRLSDDERQMLLTVMKDLTARASKLRPLKEAQVSAGGIVSDEVNPETLESRFIEGLYFAGEILDADGDSGGFNLQWAWSSGYVAGISAAN